MNIKRFNLELPKMDYQIINITVKEDGEPIKLGTADKIYMTVRDRVYNDDIVFQKTLENGISYNEETQKYEIVITSEDTNNTEIEKKYGYDIVIYFDGNKPKQQIVGTFTITEKYTMNEVS